MHKIFKYDLENRDGKWYCNLPKDSVIIRTDYVDDGYYKGFFVWAIVDPEDKDFEETEVPFIPTDDSIPKTDSCQLGYVEDQSVELPNNIKIDKVRSENGKLFLHYHTYNPLESSIKKSKYRIILRKTGQEIGLPLTDIIYIGWGRLWIKQELAVYAFLVKD